MADRDLQVQLATGNEGEAPSNSSSVKDSSSDPDSGNEGIVSDPAADHEGEEGNEEEGEGEEEEEEEREVEGEAGEGEEEGEGEGESDFSDSEDEDLQQLVQTLQSFVQDWSKSLVAALEEEDWVCIRQCVSPPQNPPSLPLTALPITLTPPMTWRQPLP